MTGGNTNHYTTTDLTAEVPGAASGSPPTRRTRSWIGGLPAKIESREIRTPNLLIWSQTRCRCAIPPFNVPQRNIREGFQMSCFALLAERAKIQSEKDMLAIPTEKERQHSGEKERESNRKPATARGFEPLRAEPNGFLVHHLSHSVTLSTRPTQQKDEQSDTPHIGTEIGTQRPKLTAPEGLPRRSPTLVLTGPGAA